MKLTFSLFVFPIVAALTAFFPAFDSTPMVADTAGRTIDLESAKDPDQRWADSVYATLTDDRRIGQLFMLRAHSDGHPEHPEAELERLVVQYQPGGLCFFQGTPERQAELTNRYQALSGIPMLIAMDAETGLGMRLAAFENFNYRRRTGEYAMRFPTQLVLGALRDDRPIYDMGREIARQCRRIGVNVSFSPVADVNNNAANPVINDRSFGEDRAKVTAKAFQYMMGLQDGGVMACAKHFPGHGDTDVDSHFDLPVIHHDARRLDSLELFPFRVLSQYRAGSMMIAHLHIPALDPDPQSITTLSRPVVTDLLRKKMDFQGLIFTDAMEMEAMKKNRRPGQAELETLRAGCDIVLLPLNFDSAVASVKAALADGSYERGQFETSVKRVLAAKHRLGLHKSSPVDLQNVRADINRPEALALKRSIFRKALTLVRDRDGLTGFPDLEKFRFATLALGDTNRTVFQTTCGFYAPMAHFNAGQTIDSLQNANLLKQLADYDVVLLSFHQTRTRSRDNFGLMPDQLKLMEDLRYSGVHVVVTYFGNPYALKFFDDMPAVLLAFTEDPLAQEVAAEALFGAADIEGALPVTAGSSAKFGQGIVKKFPKKRLAYDLPETVGMSSDTLAQMDALANEIISTGAAPGCQILVAKDGRIVWRKAYGDYDYTGMQPVTNETLYDLASITKVAATTPVAMRLVEQGRLDLSKPMSAYVPELRETNKSALTVGDILAHQAGLQPWIPFYEKTLDKDKRPLARLYAAEPKAEFGVSVAKNLWLRTDYPDTIWRQIFESPLLPKREYKYSDLGLYMTARAVNNITHRSLDSLVDEQFYRPLGLSTTFNPWRKGLTGRCAPTERDDYFRYQVVQGYVHDMGAAMLGGVGGHAGLFGTSTDLAVLFQMLLNGGSYGPDTYFKPETVRMFTTRYNGSTRRGPGFDMKQLDPHETPNMSALAGTETFGHMGFTGNVVWADPDKNLIFIFLSNRTYPSMKNNLLINGDYRPRLHSIVYKAIF